VAGSNLRFLVTNLTGRSHSVFAFYNDRGECENRIEEFQNGFAADRLSCHRFRANAFRLLLHSFAYNLVNLFRLRLPPALRSAQIETPVRTFMAPLLLDSFFTVRSGSVGQSGQDSWKMLILL